MKSNYFKTIILSFVSLVLAGSCTTSSDEVVEDQILGHCLSYSEDLDSRARSFDRLSFTAQYNYSSYTVDLTVTGVVLPQAGSTTGQRLPKMTFKSLPWMYNKHGWKEINVSNVTPEITGVSEPPSFKSLNFMLLDVFNGATYAPGIQYDFVVDNDFSGNDSSVEIVGCCMNGKTVSTDPTGVSYIPEEDNNLAEKNRPAYWIDFDFEKSKADIYLYNAKFISSMPSLNLVFPGVDITVASGSIDLSCAALTPEYDNIPFESFPITQLKGTVDFISGTTLEFHCNYRGSDYTIKFEGKY